LPRNWSGGGNDFKQAFDALEKENRASYVVESEILDGAEGEAETE
jgi:hypothetical protein